MDCFSIGIIDLPPLLSLYASCNNDEVDFVFKYMFIFLLQHLRFIPRRIINVILTGWHMNGTVYPIIFYQSWNAISAVLSFYTYIDHLTENCNTLIMITEFIIYFHSHVGCLVILSYPNCTGKAILCRNRRDVGYFSAKYIENGQRPCYLVIDVR